MGPRNMWEVLAICELLPGMSRNPFCQGIVDDQTHHHSTVQVDEHIMLGDVFGNEYMAILLKLVKRFALYNTILS